MKKVTFISEQEYEGKLDLEATDNWNFDVLLCRVMDANHLCVFRFLKKDVPKDIELGDIIFFITPKTIRVTAEDLKYIKSFNPKAKICILQEGTRLQWQDGPIDRVQHYTALYKAADLILTHSDIDSRYYKAFNKNVMTLPSMIHLDDVQLRKVSDYENKPNATFINGNLTSEFNIPFQVEVAKNGPHEIYIPTVSAIHPIDYTIYKDYGVKQFKYLKYDEWLPVLTGFKIILNVVNSYGACSQSMMAAALGIPCIGNRESVIHKELFPSLSLEPFNYEHCIKVYQLLINDKVFYKECRNYALEKIKERDFKVLGPKFRKDLEEKLWPKKK